MKVIFHIGSKKKPQLGSIREAEEVDLLEFYDGGRYTVRYVDHVVAAKKQIRTQPLESPYGRISDAMWVPFDSVIGISREEESGNPSPNLSLCQRWKKHRNLSLSPRSVATR